MQIAQYFVTKQKFFQYRVEVALAHTTIQEPRCIFPNKYKHQNHPKALCLAESVYHIQARNFIFGSM